jgi:hypothetical protein
MGHAKYVDSEDGVTTASRLWSEFAEVLLGRASADLCDTGVR